MTCIVFGGSGQIGQFLLPRLRARGVAVVAFSRAPKASDAGVAWLRGSLPDAVPPLPPAATAIVCLGPLDHFAPWLARTPLPGAPRIVAMSSMSAESKRDAPDAAERALAARLCDAERSLAERCAALGCPRTILRATLIYGTGVDGSLARLARHAMRWRVFPLPRGGGLRQPVHAEDLALAAEAALECPAGAGIVPVGGGERLTASAMFERVRESLPHATLALPLPRALLRLAASVSGRGRGMVARLDRDLLADNTTLLRVFGVQPRAFTPQSVTWGQAKHNH
jgi:nucleoside-diphosphate-sugar epimerase